MSHSLSEAFIDQFSVDALIQRERAARDAGQWDEMAACYSFDSHIEVSWFKGSGLDFVAQTEKMASGGMFTLHQMSPSVVSIKGNRALAESPCCVYAFLELDGVDIQITSFTRLLWRATRVNNEWLIAGMRAYYMRDTIASVVTGAEPEIDLALYRSFRAPYRSIAYVMSQAGKAVPDDLPGVDRPLGVAALRQEDQKWLSGQ